MSSEIVTIYSRTQCVQCDATKRALAKAGIAFIEVELEDESEQLAAFKADGFRQAPVVLTADGQAWSGFRPDLIKGL